MVTCDLHPIASAFLEKVDIRLVYQILITNTQCIHNSMSHARAFRNGFAFGQDYFEFHESTEALHLVQMNPCATHMEDGPSFSYPAALAERFGQSFSKLQG